MTLTSLSDLRHRISSAFSKSKLHCSNVEDPYEDDKTPLLNVDPSYVAAAINAASRIDEHVEAFLGKARYCERFLEETLRGLKKGKRVSEYGGKDSSSSVDKNLKDLESFMKCLLYKDGYLPYKDIYVKGNDFRGHIETLKTMTESRVSFVFPGTVNIVERVQDFVLDDAKDSWVGLELSTIQMRSLMKRIVTTIKSVEVEELGEELKKLKKCIRVLEHDLKLFHKSIKKFNKFLTQEVSAFHALCRFFSAVQYLF